MKKPGTYHAIASFVLIQRLVPSPYVSIASHVHAEPLERLPREVDMSILGGVKVSPEEGRRVARDLGCSIKPFYHFLHVDPWHKRIFIRADEMHVSELPVVSLGRKRAEVGSAGKFLPGPGGYSDSDRDSSWAHSS